QQIIDEVMHITFTRLPVWKESPDNIIGVIHIKLLLREVRRCNGDFSKVILANMIMDPWFIPESTTLFDQLQAFRKRGEHFSIMVDEYGAFMGVVTLEDILEEIVGEISDEHDVEVTGVRPQTDGSYIVEGKVTIRDLNRELDWGLPDEEYSTIAGLLLFESQRIPDVGQTYTFFNFSFKILRKQKNQISLVRITPLPEKPEYVEHPHTCEKKV
ncbi:MAG: CBS domain-containing protein, partial [Alphaproteobacteria bacterium]|nr:CBS domain-containing protein [Alphaproteobacteria bacterium]